MLYLLDANVLIDADRDYYAIERVPEFWDWLLEMATSGRVKIPEENFEEIVRPQPENPDPLIDWALANRDNIVLNETVIESSVGWITAQGYAEDLSDIEIEKLGRDPFLMAYAHVDPDNRVVVTTEVSASSKTRANRKIPDVCQDLGIRSIDTFELIRELDFRTDWKARTT